MRDKMGEEVMMTDYEVPGDGDDEAAGDCCEEDRVLEWEMGLPSCEDLTPLSQSLVPPELALAFSISPERSRTIQDVNRASQTTLSALRNGSTGAQVTPYNNNDNFFKTTVAAEEEDRVGSSCVASDTKKQKKSDDGGGSTAAEEADSGTDDPSARALKRPRLVWTPQLHKRFVDVVAHLGIKNAVPKTIMQLMNVEGLTRENVASHLQKYRLYLKRMQGLTTEDPSSSDHLLSSKPVPPQSFHDGSGIGGGTGQSNGAFGQTSLPMRVPYGGPPPMLPMPMPVYGHMGMQGYHHHHHHHHHHATGGPGVFESNPFMMQQKDWPGNKYGSMASYPSVGGGGVNDK